MSSPIRIAGVDFTSAPRPRKPITIARGTLHEVRGERALLRVHAIDALATFEAWEQWLRAPGPWIAGFDFPFSVARAFVAAQGWPTAGPDAWARTIEAVHALTRAELVARCRGWCAQRPVGDKFARRVTEVPAGCSAAMKWVNPPVALMLHAGAPRLLHAGVDVPALHRGDPSRVALEAYPGLLARAIVARASYKSDERSRQTPERTAVRERLSDALERGEHALGVRVAWPDALRRACVDDASGDRIDAVLCAVQSAWGWLRRDRGYGLPDDVDPLEGWIVSAVPSGVAHAAHPDAPGASRAASRDTREVA